MLYLADLPEEKSVLCLKSGSCTRPCSKCDVFVQDAGSLRALNAKDRRVLRHVPQQIECSQLRLTQTQRQRRAYLEESSSVNSTFPSLAGMAGLGTYPFLLYNMIGFDILHVRVFMVHRGRRTCGQRVARAQYARMGDPLLKVSAASLAWHLFALAPFPSCRC